jgi:plasmid maintenance system antidote protein VapI
MASKKAFAIHPGEILREEFMKPLKLSSYRLAKELKSQLPA